MPHVHRVASLLKRWILGTHQGGIKLRQLDAYLDEFVFRFNRRTARSRGLLFFRLLEQAVQIDHIRERRIIARRQPAEPGPGGAHGRQLRGQASVSSWARILRDHHQTSKPPARTHDGRLI